MDSFDKKVSDIFNSDSHVEVPAEFSWSEMNEGIYQKLDTKEPKRRPIFWFWIGGIASLTSLALILWIFNIENTNTESVKTSKSDKIALLETPKSSTTQPVNSKKTISQNKFENNKNDSNISSAISAKIPLESISISNIDESKNISYPNKNRSEIQLNVDSRKLNNDYVVISNTQKSSEKLNSKNTKHTSNQRHEIVINPLLKIDYDLLNQQNDKIELKTYTRNKNIKKQQSRQNKSQSVTPLIYGGTLFGFGSYSGATDREANSTWIPGYYFGVKIPFLRGKKYNLYTGYEHKFAVQKFEINSTKSVVRPIEHALVHTNTNVLTGRKTHTYSDTTGLSIVTHDYTNYNTFRSNTLYLGIQRSTKIGPLSIGLSAGAAYSFLILSKGKTIGNDHNIIDYNTSNPIYRKNNWSIESGIDLDFFISEKLTINLHAKGEQSLNNWSIEEGVSLSPSFMKVGGGVKYLF